MVTFYEDILTLIGSFYCDMRPFSNTILIFIACQFGCLVLFGQEPTLKGRIVDSKSGEPIPFATILLKGKGQQGTLGLVSNTEGDFRIPVRYSERVDTVVISCIGYVTKKFLIGHLSEERIQIVRMDEATLQLGEVEIRGNRQTTMTALNIVRSAIRNIPFNYPSSPESYVAYYRDYQLRKKEYINLNEAIVEVFDEGFNTSDQLSTKMLLYDYKRNKEFDRDTTTEVLYDNHRTKFIPGAKLYHYGGNELVILRVHDALRNYNIESYSFVGMLETDFVKNHKFNLDKTIFLNETPLYQISFFSKGFASGKGHIARGIIYIEHGNYAIHKMEYTTYELADSKEKTLYDIQVEYSRTDAAMRLNYLSFNNFFSLRDPRDFEVRDMTFDKRMMAMEVIFNKEPSRESISDLNNFEVIYRGQKMVITKVRAGDVLRGEPANCIYLYLHSFLFPTRNSGELTSDFVIKFKDIYDTVGRLLNKVNYIPVNQFREIFVQKATAQGMVASDSLYVKKDMPLSESPQKNIAQYDDEYWMNTPLRPAPEKPFVALDPDEENE